MLPRLRSTLRHMLRDRTGQQRVRANRHHAEGLQAEARSDWDAASASYKQAMLLDFQNADHQLRLAMALDRLKRGEEARAHALVAISSTLNARYDAQAALRVHPTFFAARHEMANFILDNHAELTRRVQRRRDASQKSTDGPTKVFVYWDKPESMPAIVKACRTSLQRFVDDGFELVELDDRNLADYVSIDASVRTQLAATPAHFSDYVRSRLLQEHGGLWLDSTCLLTRPLSEVVGSVRDEDSFLFTYSGSRVGSWFFWSHSDAYVLNAITEVEVLWWEENSQLTNYFMWHDIVEMLYWTDPRYTRAWDAMRKEHPRAALALLGDLNKPYDQGKFDLALAGSGIHKLTHKLPQSALTGDTFAAHILDAHLSSATTRVPTSETAGLGPTAHHSPRRKDDPVP